MGSRGDPVAHGLRDLDFHAAGEHLRPGGGPLQFLDQGRKAVDPPALRVQVDEVARLAGVLAHAGQPEILDHVGGEALFVLHLHRVEDAAVGIDADEKGVFRSEIDHAATFRSVCGT